MATSAFGYDFTPFDWSTVKPGDTVSISGKAILATEADMPYVNSCKVALGGTGYLVISNATTDCALTFASGGSTGYLVKMGKSRQSFKNQLGGFYGAFVVEEGTAVCAGYYTFGNPQEAWSDHPNVYVRKGATAEIAFATVFYIRGFHVAGEGVDGKGAVILKAGDGLIQKLYLDDDAYIVSEVAGDFVQGRDKASSGYSAKVNPGVLELNGHALTLGGSSTRIGLSKCTVTDSVGTGKIVYEAAASGDRVVQFAGSNTTLSVPIVFEGDTTVRLYNSCAPIASPVTANGSLTFTYACDSGAGAGLTDAYNKWTGDIAFTTPGSVLRFTPSNASYQLTLTGAVSGDANLEIGTAGTPAQGVVRLGGHNTYTGTSVINGTADLSVLVDYDDSIPDATKLTVNGGIVTPRVVPDGEGGYTWTPSAYLDYVAPQVNGKTGAKVSVDITALTDGEFTFSGDEIATKLADAAGLLWSALGTGTGRYTLTGPFDESKPLNLNIPAGTVRLTGEEPIRLGTTLVTGAAAKQGGTLVLDGAADVSFDTDSIFIGKAPDSSVRPRGKMVIANSYLHSTCACSLANETGALSVGHQSEGLLYIEDGSIVSNGLLVGCGSYGIGAVVQRGGTVYPKATSAIGAGEYHGSYELRGGSLTMPSGSALAVGRGGGGAGVMMQYGGTVTAPSGFALGGGDNSHRGIYYMKGGLFEKRGGDMTLSYASWTHSVLTLDGPMAQFRDLGTPVLYCCQHADNTAIVNLNNGGVFETGYINPIAASYSSAVPVLLNFNGGVFRAAWYYANPFSEAKKANAMKLVVYEKGICFDTYYPGGKTGQSAGGKTLNTTGVNIEGVTGDGVQSIAVPEGGIPGFIAAPYVQIASTDPGAYGATAVAEVDPETATVTNIVVTSHGWGYTAANTTVSIRYSNSQYDSIAAAYAIPKENVTIGPNTVGGLTKIGVGTLNVYGTNTWAQWTRVDAGTLAVKTSGSIPSGTELILNGGTLDLNGFDANAERPTTFSGIAGTGGEVKNGIVKVIGEWKISAKKFIDRETTVLKGALDLTACTKIVLADTDVLDETAEQLKRLELFKTTSTTWPENLVIEGVPQGWSMKRTATGLKLGYDHGALLIVR